VRRREVRKRPRATAQARQCCSAQRREQAQVPLSESSIPMKGSKNDTERERKEVYPATSDLNVECLVVRSLGSYEPVRVRRAEREIQYLVQLC